MACVFNTDYLHGLTLNSLVTGVRQEENDEIFILPTRYPLCNYVSLSRRQKLCEWGIMADLIEIDAGHDFISAWGDINRAYRILRPGGVLFGHDYFTAADNRGVRRAVHLFAEMNKFKITTDGQHWVIDTA